MLRLSVIAVLGLQFFSAAAAKPRSAGPLDPKIGYIFSSAKGSELRLSNEDGTNWTTLVKTSGQMSMSLGPLSGRQLVYTDGYNIRLLTYELTSTGPKTVANRVLATLDRSSPRMRFSPMGTHVAFVWPSRADVWIIDLATGDMKALVETPSSAVIDIDFSLDGSELIYNETEGSDFSHLQFKSVPVRGGSPTTLSLSGRYGYFRVSHSGDSLVADTSDDWQAPVTLMSSDGSSPQVIASAGYTPAFNCDDTVVIFNQRTSSRGAQTVSILKYDVTTGGTSTFSTKDRGWAEYLC